MRDAELVAGILDGSVDFAVLWDQYWSRVYDCIRKMVGDAELAKDLANCVLERANEQLARFDAKRGNLWTWLHLKVRTVVIAHFRRPRLRTVSLDVLDDSREPTCEGRSIAVWLGSASPRRRVSSRAARARGSS